MADLFNNKYRISSARLQSWDYGREAMYFVTICTKNREYYFGEIVETQCVASESESETQRIASLNPTEIGTIAATEWYKTVELRPDMNLELGEFVVMPNHIHGIIIIGDGGRDAMHRVSAAVDDDDRDATHRVAAVVDDDDRDAMHRVSTDNTNTEYKNQFAPQSKNLASIIRGYKSSVTTYARKNDIVFDWQPRFHDHIIRSMDDYHRISDYILNNPAKWQKDKFF